MTHMHDDGRKQIVIDYLSESLNITHLRMYGGDLIAERVILELRVFFLRKFLLKFMAVDFRRSFRDIVNVTSKLSYISRTDDALISHLKVIYSIFCE